MVSNLSRPFTAALPVRFTHTDPAGYVFFPRYFDMLHEVMEDWFTNAIGFRFADLILNRRIGTPTASIQCNFLRPCQLGEQILVAVRLEHIGNTSFRLRFQGSVGGELHLDALLTLVVITLGNGRPLRIPDDLRARMEEYREIDAPMAAAPPLVMRQTELAREPAALQTRVAAIPFCASYPVRFTHTDPAGYVFFPRYFDMLQAAVEDWFTEALSQPYAELYNLRRLGTPAAATQARFVHPSRFGDRLSIAVQLEEIGNTSMRLRFLGTVAEELRLEAMSTLVMINLDDGYTRSIPDDLRARMEDYRRRQNSRLEIAGVVCGSA
ncbi:MAG: acyl-CoA thioesterase [Beijerinckiaceae bacterium]